MRVCPPLPCRKDPKLKTAREKSWAQTELMDANYLKTLEAMMEGDSDGGAAATSDDDASGTKPLP